MLCVLRSGVRWPDVSKRYGRFKNAHERFARWWRACGGFPAKSGAFAIEITWRSTERLCVRSFGPQLVEEGLCGLGSGRSQGELTGKWHIAVDTFGRRLRLTSLEVSGLMQPRPCRSQTACQTPMFLLAALTTLTPSSITSRQAGQGRSFRRKCHAVLARL